MILSITTLMISLILLLWSANHLVEGASGVARQYKISPLMIGLTVVAIGTTAPEIMIAIVASLDNKTDMALGNAIGSNIANIGLVLGFTALIQPLKIQSKLIKREYPILFIIMMFSYILFLDGYLNRIDGILLLLGSLVLMIYFAHTAQKVKKTDRLAKEFKQVFANGRSMKVNVISLFIGLILLPISARFLVQSAADIAQALGISELVIGLSIIAIGTSLPELATSVIAAYKKEDDIAIGNILGSNMFNILLVIAFPGIINPDNINSSIIWRDIPFMILLTIALFFFNFNAKGKMGRWHGGILLVIYIGYLTILSRPA